MLGHREDRQLIELVRGARAVVVPSEWYEPFSLVILEAMAAARPVIASRVAGPAEIISHGADGLLGGGANGGLVSDGPPVVRRGIDSGVPADKRVLAKLDPANIPMPPGFSR